MPRSDLKRLGLEYRRIPVLSIGRDIFLDTRLILRKLEERFPVGKLGSEDPQEKFIEGLLQRYMVEGPVFSVATGFVPPDLMSDDKVLADRKGFCGRDWTKESLEAGRSECLAYVRNLFEFLEETILADGREWVLGGKGVSLADIEAIWPVDWLVGIEGAMPPDIVSEQRFPRVYGWIKRFNQALSAASAAEPVVLDGDGAASFIKESSWMLPRGIVEEGDCLSLGRDANVQVYPGDWGSEHCDSGMLAGLGPDEVTILTNRGEVGEVQIHAPRTGFKITEIGGRA